MRGRRMARPRSEANYGPEPGDTYLLEVYDPETGLPARLGHAGHYTGWAPESGPGLKARFKAHRRGRGARFTRAVRQAGLAVRLVQTWPGTTKDFEDKLKHFGGARKYCPGCNDRPWLGPQLLPEWIEADGITLKPEPQPEPEPEVTYYTEPGPPLTADMSAIQAAEFTAAMEEAAADAFSACGVAWSTDEYDMRFDTACDVTKTRNQAAAEAELYHGRSEGEPVGEWIARTRQDAQVSTTVRHEIEAQRAEPEPERLWPNRQAPVPEVRWADQPHARTPAHRRHEGAPHPDPALAARGWQVVNGMYARVPPPEPDPQPDAEPVPPAGLAMDPTPAPQAAPEAHLPDPDHSRELELEPC